MLIYLKEIVMSQMYPFQLGLLWLILNEMCLISLWSQGFINTIIANVDSCFLLLCNKYSAVFY